MLNQYVNKKSEFELLDLLDKKQSLQIAIEDLEAEFKESMMIQEQSMNSHRFCRHPIANPRSEFSSLYIFHILKYF